MTSIYVCMQSETGADNRFFKEWALEKETELRLEVGEEHTIDIKVCILYTDNSCMGQVPYSGTSKIITFVGNVVFFFSAGGEWKCGGVWHRTG